MSKFLFRGKTCIYCLREPSTPTGDHVFARQFFLTARRGYLPKVPACLGCGNTKSALERYLTAVLPLGGRHVDAVVNAESALRRVANNAKLHRELAANVGTAWSEISPGISVPMMTLPFESGHLHELFEFIIKGLMWHHWQVELPPEFEVKVLSLTRVGEKALSFLQNFRTNNRVTCDLGEGTFTYEGVQGAGYPEMSVWKCSVSGGVIQTGAPEAPHEEISRIGAITARRSFLKKPEITKILS